MTVYARAAAPIRRVYDVVVPIDLTTIFTGYGPLPAVVGVRDQSGPWDRPGQSRVVELADGSEAPERLTALDPPHGFAYRVGPFTSSLRLLVDDAEGGWEFSPIGADATDVRWTYAFAPRRFTRPLVRFVVAPLWRRYAERALAAAVGQAERS